MAANAWFAVTYVRIDCDARKKVLASHGSVMSCLLVLLHHGIPVESASLALDPPCIVQAFRQHAHERDVIERHLRRVVEQGMGARVSQSQYRPDEEMHKALLLVFVCMVLQF